MRKPVLWGIWQPSRVCVSLTEQNQRNQPQSQDAFSTGRKKIPGREAEQRRDGAGLLKGFKVLYSDTPELAAEQLPWT